MYVYMYVCMYGQHCCRTDVYSLAVHFTKNWKLKQKIRTSYIQERNLVQHSINISRNIENRTKIDQMEN
jgi:hypothetical protein